MAGISEGVRLPPGKRKKDCNDLYKNFVCMFGETIEPDVILTVLESRNWNVDEAAEDLMNLQADFTDKAETNDQIKFETDSQFFNRSFPDGRQSKSGSHKVTYAFNENWTERCESKPVAVNCKNKTSADHPDGTMYRFNDSWNKRSNSKENKCSDIEGSPSYTFNENWSKSLDLSKAVVQNKSLVKTESEDAVDDESENDEDEDSSNEEDVDEEEEESRDDVEEASKNCHKINLFNGSDDDDADVIIEEEKEYTIKDDDSSNGILNLDSLTPQFHSLNLGSGISWGSSSLNDRQHSLPFYHDFQETKKEAKSNQPKSKKDDKKNVNKSQLKTFVINYNKALAIKNDVDRISSLVSNGVKVSVILRGCPGSGKSYLADLIMKKINKTVFFLKQLHHNAHVFSTDDYFTSRRGNYNFSHNKLSDAHDWNQLRVSKALKLGRSPVIVDNTNSQIWEIKPYFVLAVQNGYHIEVLEPNTKWRYNENELAKRNVHNVPKKQIKNMLDRFELDLTTPKLLTLFNVRYPKNLKPPQTMPFLNLFEESNEKNKKTRTRKKKSTTVDVIPPSSGVNQQPSTSNLEVHTVFQAERDCVTEKFESNSKALITHKKLNASVATNNSFSTDLSADNISNNSSGVASEEISEVFNDRPCTSYDLNSNDEFKKCVKNLDEVVENYSTINKFYSKLVGDVTCEDADKNSSLIQEHEVDGKDIKKNYHKKLRFGCTDEIQGKDFKTNNDLRLEYVDPSTMFYKKYEQAKKITNDYERIFTMILNKVKIIVFLRGCPGSGKTYLAKELIQKVNKSLQFGPKLEYSFHVLSADDYFMSSSGYFFDRHKLSEAYLWNEDKGKLAVENGLSPVIIDNCNGDIDDMKPYVEVAVKHGYVVDILEPDTDWKFNEDELVKRNIHGVLRMKIRYLLDKYKKDLTSEKLLRDLNLYYPLDKKPPRTYDIFKGYATFEKNQQMMTSSDILINLGSIHETNWKNDQFSCLPEQEIVFSQKNETDLQLDDSSVNSNLKKEIEIGSEKPEKLFKEEENAVDKPEKEFENKDSLAAVDPNGSLMNNVEKMRFCPIYQSIANDFKNVFDRVCVLALCRVKVLVLLRGFHSTGKTYAAHSLIEKINNLRKTEVLPLIYFEHVFNGENKPYNFLEYINKAIYPSIQNLNRIKAALQSSTTPIIIDSCNIKLTDMQPYAEIAVNYGYIVEILEPDTDWRFDEFELSRRNIFDTMEEARKWLRIYERNVDGRQLLEYFNLKYNPELLPKLDKDLCLTVLQLMCTTQSNFISSEKDKNSLLENFESAVNFKDFVKKEDSLSITVDEEFLGDEKTMISDDVKFKNIFSSNDVLGKNKISCISLEDPSKDKNSQKADIKLLKEDEKLSINFNENTSSSNDLGNIFSGGKFSSSESLNDDDLAEKFDEECTSSLNSLNDSNTARDFNSSLCSDETISTGTVERNDRGSIIENNCSTVSTCRELILIKDSERILSLNESPLVVEENVSKEDVAQLKIDSNSSLCSDETISTGTVERNYKGLIIEDNCSTVSTCREFILIKGSERILSIESPLVIEENVAQLKISNIGIKLAETICEKCDVTEHLDSLNNFGSDIETLKNNYSSISKVDNGGAEYDSEVCCSEKLNDLKMEDVSSSKHELEKINVIDWLAENKKSNSEFDVKNINNVRFGDENQSNELNSTWKSWETSETSTLVKKDNANQNLHKPPRDQENPRKSDPSRNIVTGLPTKPSKIPKEFLGWSTVPDPRSDWYGRVKDTISGTSSSVETPKPPRNLYHNRNICVESCSNREKNCDSEIEKQRLSSGSSNSTPDCKNLHEGLVTLLRGSSPVNATVQQDNPEISNDDLFEEEEIQENRGMDPNYSSGDLSNMFPHVASVYLKDLLEKCHGDTNWVAEILLEENQNENINFLACPSSDSIQNYRDYHHESMSSNLENTNASVNEFRPDADQSIKNVKKVVVTKNKKFLNRTSSELKKIIENSIVLNASSYSENILKLIRQRRGRNIPNSDGNVEWMLLPEEEEDVEELLSSNIIPDMSGCEETGSSNLEGDVNAVSGYVPEEDNEGTIELIFNKDLISKLNENFGSPYLPQHMFEQGLSVELPKSLAQQLHGYIMDAVQLQIDDEYSQMERMIAEDEEFARRLQEFENGSPSRRNSSPNLQEIIDMETALAIYKADLEKSTEKKDSNETFAARLGKSILLEKFPNIDQHALLELYNANSNSLHDTISALVMNQDSEMNLNDWERQLLEKAKQESAKDNQLASNDAEYYDGSEYFCHENPSGRHLALSDFEYFREEAAKHRKERNECFRKAKEAYNQGNKNVAAYYSQLANLHLLQIEQTNHKAAAALLSVHKSTSEETLDLHFYQVKEALEVLDLFLDSSINRLKEKQKSKVTLYVITGRGLHSSNGKSKLRPVVMQKLKSRQLKFSIINPGMLRVIITKNTPLSLSVGRK